MDDKYSVSIFKEIATNARIEILYREYKPNEYLWKIAFDSNSKLLSENAQSPCDLLKKLEQKLSSMSNRQYILFYPDCSCDDIKLEITYEDESFFEITSYYVKGEFKRSEKMKIN